MKTGEWGLFVEGNHTVRDYFCGECRIFSAEMHVRRVVEGEDNVHKEYMIVCPRCGKKGTLHWSKNLAEHSWKASNPNWNDDYISRTVEEKKEMQNVAKR